jgi:hypothetical protein
MMSLEEACSRIELCIKLNLSLNGPQERYALRMLLREIRDRTTLTERRQIEGEELSWE